MKLLPLDDANALARASGREPPLDLGMPEVKEVARVVPDEALLLDGLAPAADFTVGLEDEVVVVAALGEGRGGREAGDAGADDERTNGIHGAENCTDLQGWLATGRARVAAEMLDERAGLAQPREGARDVRVVAVTRRGRPGRRSPTTSPGWDAIRYETG